MPTATLRVITAATLLVTLLLAGGLLATSGMTLSAAVFALAIQRIADATCHALLLFGAARATRAEREGHRDLILPELRFWSLTAGLLVFSLASGVAISEGIARLGTNPQAITKADLAVWVLAAILAADIALFGAVRRAANPAGAPPRPAKSDRAAGDPMLRASKLIRTSAIVGNLLAAAGLALYGGLGWRQGDAAAAVAIALLMGIVAALFSLEVRSALASSTWSLDAVAAPDPVESPRTTRVDVAPIPPSTLSSETSRPTGHQALAGPHETAAIPVERPANANAQPRGNFPPGKPGKGKKKRR